MKCQLLFSIEMPALTQGPWLAGSILGQYFPGKQEMPYAVASTCDTLSTSSIKSTIFKNRIVREMEEKITLAMR